MDSHFHPAVITLMKTFSRGDRKLFKSERKEIFFFFFLTFDECHLLTHFYSEKWGNAFEMLKLCFDSWSLRWLSFFAKILIIFDGSEICLHSLKEGPR